MDENDIYAWMYEHVQHDAPRILEIGAHHCEDSERFMQMFYVPLIIAFEPDPRNVAVIRAKNLPLVLVDKAVGNKDGTTQLYMSGGMPRNATGIDRTRDWTYSSSVRKPKMHLKHCPTVEFTETAMVKICKLDTVMGGNVIDFIWCDVQGNEGDVIRGGMETLTRTRYFYTEFDNREMYEGQDGLETIKSLLGSNFNEVGQFGSNVLFKNVLF